MKIFAHHYELKSATSFNAKSSTAHSGALLRCEFLGGLIGYADLHPWPEFGDAPLTDHLRLLQDERPTVLGQIALALARVDAVARSRSRNLLMGLDWPLSHAVVTNMVDVERAAKNGFTTLKLKMNVNLQLETQLLSEASRIFPQMKWRLDFNGSLEFQKFLEWWEKVSPEVKTRLDFIEDPCEDPERLPAGPWAMDWLANPSAKVRIVKPTRDSLASLAVSHRVVFTHAGGHELGRLSNVWLASQFYKKYPAKREVCGLSGGQQITARFMPPLGTGFGLDEQLKGMMWEQI